MPDQEDDTGESQGGGFRADQAKSYLAFAKRAIAQRWISSAVVFCACFALTIAAVIYVPRTYICKTVLMGLGSPVLDGRDTGNPLAAAEALVMRRENLEAIVRDTDLVRKFDQRRPPLLKLKAKITAALFGEPNPKVKMASMVGTLQTKLSVTPERGDQSGQLTVRVEWSDGATAAEIAEAARESFIRARRTAEVSAFEDKAAILDAHASKLRDDIGVLAEQVNAAGRQTAPNSGLVAPDKPTTGAPTTRIVRTTARASDSSVSQELSTLKEKLAADKPKLAELETDWNRRLRDQQAKLADLQLRLTPQHPQVVTEQERLTMLQQPPPDVLALRSEIKVIEGDIKARELTNGRAASVVTTFGGATESLPTAVVEALDKDGADPALRAQLSGAVVKYGDLRGEILMGRIDLDTAQAAFNHRYQVIVPAEAPSKAEKPNPVLIIVGGLFLSLLLSLALPIISELRGGVIVETWQVHHLQLPVLAELKLPPHTD